MNTMRIFESQTSSVGTAVDKQFSLVFDAIRGLMQPLKSRKYPIGFVHGKKEGDESDNG